MNVPEVLTTWQAEVIVLPKQGVNDPEGEAILGGLHSLGHAAVGHVRAGRVLRLTIDAPDEASAQSAVGRMCEQLLANPVIESYHVSVTSEERDAKE
ncbi:MAG: phosphoribosylformylglycinamidine synthase subunit PurS [Thermomicrobiales bacterium]